MSETQSSFETEILSIVAHDMKTPVGAAKGFLDLIEKTGPLNDTQQRFADKAMNAIQRIEELVANILDYARLEGGIVFEFAPCDISQMIKQELDLLYLPMETRGLTADIDSSIDSLFVLGDARFLARVISNLLSNAVKYNREDGDIFIRAFTRETTVRIDIQDTGMGIPDDELPRIFDQFYRSNLTDKKKIDGTGIGLAITKMIIAKHGGEIKVESEPGVGSTFTIILPKVQTQKRQSRERGVHRRFNEMAIDSQREQSDAVDDDTQEGAEFSDSDSMSEGL